MPFILISIAFLISGFVGWMLSKDYKVNENCSESVSSGKTNKLAIKGFFVIGLILLIIGIITLLL